MQKNTDEFRLSMLGEDDRYRIYQLLVNGCTHLWSKGKLQEDKIKPILEAFMNLADKDPFFLAHFTSYAVTRLQSKDLKVVSIFANSLSDADGTPFIVSRGAEGISYSKEYKKPNLRIISQAAVQELDPKLISRLIELANLKLAPGPRFGEGTHFSRSLKTAIRKWLRYREQNPKALEGIKKAGFSRIVKKIYRGLHLAPSDEAAASLRWKQKDGRAIVKKAPLTFTGLSTLEIAEKIRAEKIPPLAALGALPEQLSPVIAVAVLEQTTGDQAVILQSLFDRQGLLQDKEVYGLFADKIKTARTSLDRVDRINTTLDKDVEQTLKQAKAEKRKSEVGNIGRIFVHIDISSSMDSAIEFAKKRGAVIAECVPNPEENFFWGLFNQKGYILDKPDTFEEAAFMARLYGVRAYGSTHCLACYEYAREKKCDVDVYITDQEHNGPSIVDMIVNCDRRGMGRPQAAVIVDFSMYKAGLRGLLATQLLQAQIPVSIIEPEALTESALVSQAVKVGLKGSLAIVEEIMETPLLKLPPWWNTIK